MSKLFFLQKANEILNIKSTDNRKLIFVYTQPKVGSTSIVTSLRLYAIDKIHAIHVHDETMLQILGNINNVSIQEIIDYNSTVLSKDVYVINVYRSPIERKISAFFEKIGSFHFNNTDKNIDNYNLNRIITRFNNIFNHIANGDHYLDLYINNLSNYITDNTAFYFNYNNKYILQTSNNGVKYITLRLKDSLTHWNTILSNIFETPIKVIPDYESKNKEFSNLYKRFKDAYHIPLNYLQDIQENDKYFKFYYNLEEQKEYIQKWTSNNTIWIGYTKEQYELYQQITTENAVLDIVKCDHYLDEGCLCNNCNNKRKLAIKQINSGKYTNIHVKHEEPQLLSKIKIYTPIPISVKHYKKQIKKPMKLL